MKYPKLRVTRFVQFSENDCRQVNFHIGRKWAYIFIEPSTKPLKILNTEFELIIKGLQK